MSKPIFHVGKQLNPPGNGTVIKGALDPNHGSQSAITGKLNHAARPVAHARPLPAGRGIQPVWPLDERRKLLSQAVEMVANGTAPSLIVVGQPGVGKTYEVKKTLHALAMEPELDYFYVSGFTSPRGLFETLYANNGRLTVLDDCDSALNDAVAVELLKGALDSHHDRIISWVTAARAKSNLPTKFRFQGQVIFLSNRALSDIDLSIHSRSLVIDYHVSRKEILAFMETILPSLESAATPEQRQSGLEFVREWAPRMKHLSIRKLISVLRIITAHPTDWEPLAIHTIIQ